VLLLLPAGAKRLEKRKREGGGLSQRKESPKKAAFSRFGLVGVE